MIKPTVGRQVWFWPDEMFPGSRPIPDPGEGPVPLAATVVFVHSPNLVNLAVFDCYGNLFSQEKVYLAQDGAVAPVPFCTWPVRESDRDSERTG
jgi:hypothetical protein